MMDRDIVHFEYGNGAVLCGVDYDGILLARQIRSVTCEDCETAYPQWRFETDEPDPDFAYDLAREMAL